VRIDWGGAVLQAKNVKGATRLASHRWREYTQRPGVAPSRARVPAFLSTKTGLSVRRGDNVEVWTTGEVSDIFGGNYCNLSELVEQRYSLHDH
jgi:hypothetical protein